MFPAPAQISEHFLKAYWCKSSVLVRSPVLFMSEHSLLNLLTIEHFVAAAALLQNANLLHFCENLSDP